MTLPDFVKLLIVCALPAAYADADAPVLAPGYGTLAFTPPPAGSYSLPVLGSAADGRVLTDARKPANLYDLMGDKIVLLSFIYSTCSDINGCPLATAVFHKIKQRLQQEPDLARQLRLLTLSFNPRDDTPERMRHYGEGLKSGGLEWHFLTTASEADLAPILEQYRQSVQKIMDDQGRFTGTFSHILRVYLIDRDKQLRNIYNVSFLHPDTLINDIKTLLAPAAAIVQTEQQAPAHLFRPGDDKQNYESKDYRTHSIALSARKGKEADLIKTVYHPPRGLPPVTVPANNPITEEKIRLGRKLFYDRRLSLNNTFSCAMCHIPEQGFTSNEMKTAVGIEGRSVRRNSPTLYNVGYMTALFHDGRESTLEQQVWGPLLASNEMGNPSVGFVIDKLNHDTEYKGLFQQAFGRPADMETVGMALASYQRTLNSANSAFDRWYFGREQEALSESAQRGFRLFTGKAKCARCHT
ncbi:MAG: cytochrome c peroxidase, partial [Gammaproteobacteria bacterium]